MDQHHAPIALLRCELKTRQSQKYHLKHAYHQLVHASRPNAIRVDAPPELQWCR